MGWAIGPRINLDIYSSTFLAIVFQFFLARPFEEFSGLWLRAGVGEGYLTPLRPGGG
jgi:hypothetical protein